MPAALREQMAGFVAAVGIFYGVFLIGWLLRDRLGIPRERLKHLWVSLIVMPAALVVMMLFYAFAPRWAHSVLAIVLLGIVAPWLQSRQRARELGDPLVGREGVVVRGFPSVAQVEINGELWGAQADTEGAVLVQGDKVVVRRRNGLRLVVGK